MVIEAEIGWGSYKTFEGPYYKGKCSYILPGSPSEDEKVMAVITATEGGKFDAFNGYDSCGWTSGVIQWIEKGQYSISDMLGATADKGQSLINSVIAMAAANGVSFKKNVKGRYRFFFSDARGEIDTYDEQKQLFYIHGDGTKGSWDDSTKAYGRRWAAAISSVWENPIAQNVQIIYTASRLNGFMLPYAKNLFATMPKTSLAAGLRAAFLSFAANNPTWANNALKAGVDKSKAITWSLDWVIDILKSLTFTPQVAIYPHRYDCIRPVLEKLYGLQLPDFAKELQNWSVQTGIPVGIDTRTLQRSLIALGYDLGPAADDGVYGEKTKDAVMSLEQTSGTVPKENQDGMVDVYTFPALMAAMEAKGLPLMSM